MKEVKRKSIQFLSRNINNDKKMKERERKEMKEKITGEKSGAHK